MGGIVPVALLGVAVWLDDNGDKAARHASAQFAGALVSGAAPPEGAAAYVHGVRAYFGAVSGARVLDAHNKQVREHARSRSYMVADVFVRTAAGRRCSSWRSTSRRRSTTPSTSPAWWNSRRATLRAAH